MHAILMNGAVRMKVLLAAVIASGLLLVVPRMASADSASYTFTNSSEVYLYTFYNHDTSLDTECGGTYYQGYDPTDAQQITTESIAIYSNAYETISLSGTVAYGDLEVYSTVGSAYTQYFTNLWDVALSTSFSPTLAVDYSFPAPPGNQVWMQQLYYVGGYPYTGQLPSSECQDVDDTIFSPY